MNPGARRAALEDPSGDEAWSFVPTALDVARYEESIRISADAKARKASSDAAAARIVFGECLAKITSLGVREPQARAMLGKWRSKAGDELLRRIVDQAHAIGTPDPSGYVTKAIDKGVVRAASVSDLNKGVWQEIGWEAPRRVKGAPPWRHGVRGKVWRDPFGKLKVLPVEEGTVPPELEDEPGVEAADG